MSMTVEEHQELQVLREFPGVLKDETAARQKELTDKEKAEQLQLRRTIGDVKQRYAGARSTYEAVLESGFAVTQEYIAAKEMISAAREDCVSVEREMRRLSVPIDESVASFDARWFASERWSTFHARAKQVFGGKLL